MLIQIVESAVRIQALMIIIQQFRLWHLFQEWALAQFELTTGNLFDLINLWTPRQTRTFWLSLPAEYQLNLATPYPQEMGQSVYRQTNFVALTRLYSARGSRERI
jgi:hypothetical protein